MSARVPTPRDWPARRTRRRRHSVSSRSSWSRCVGDGALGEVVDPLPAAPLRADHLAVHQRRSTATLVPDQSHHSLAFFAPPNSVAVSGPSARSWLSDLVVASRVRQVVVQRWRGRGRRGGGRRSAATPRRAGCRRRATSTRRRGSRRGPVGLLRPSSRPTAPSRAYGTSSWERASTEIVSSCTAPRCRSTPRTPARRSGAPRKPWARRAIRRASSRGEGGTGAGAGGALRHGGHAGKA